MPDLAETVMSRIEALGEISDEFGHLTRTFCSPAMRKINELVGSWMREAGMEVRNDAIGNLIGHYAGANIPSIRGGPPEGRVAEEKTLLLGSHLDTVRNAGKFDGPLGVLIAIACVQHLRAGQTRFPFAIDVVGFADEEGVRYQSTYLGSRALAGTLGRSELERVDENRVSMADAIRSFGGDPDKIESCKLKSDDLLGYIEVHIEQGPVLEEKNMAVGVLSGIAGQTRVRLGFRGRAGHAGTTPMNLRRDALCTAAEFVLVAESLAQKEAALVATVGELVVLPGASNVIPGEVKLSLDVRHADDQQRLHALSELRTGAESIGAKRQTELEWHVVHESPAVACNPGLSDNLGQSVRRLQRELVLLPSGAGHDAAALATLCPVAMLFVRCKGGVSHHPDESVALADVRAAIDVMNDFLQTFAAAHA
jgi:allantoate deiminase